MVTHTWKLKRPCQFEIVSLLIAPLRTVSLNPRVCSTDDAFAAKHMPDLGHDVKEFKVFSWKLSNWKKLEKKLTGPEFECGGHKWWGS